MDVARIDSDRPGTDLEEVDAGFVVEAADGVVGTVLTASSDRDDGYLVVVTAPSLPRSMVLVPAGLVTRVDRQRRRVQLSTGLAEIRAAPPFESDRFRDAAYHAELSSHYARARRSAPAIH
jgi:hypothetical protein